MAGEELFSVQCTERVEVMAGDRCTPYTWRGVRWVSKSPGLEHAHGMRLAMCYVTFRVRWCAALSRAK